MLENIIKLDIFKGIPEDIVEKIILNCEEKHFEEGEIIINQGDETNGEGYILKNGEVSITNNGEEITKIKTGDIFGEIALLNEEPRTATAQAITDIEVIVLNYDNLIEMIDNDENFINKKIIQRIEDNIERGM